MPKENRVLYFIVPFCSLFIIAGAWLMFHTGRKIVVGNRAKNWPHTTARIKNVESKDTSSDEGSSREIVVRYTYRAGGQDYEGTTIHPAYGGSSFEVAHRGLEKVLKPDQQVRVYYDAMRPSTCTLSVGFYSCTLAAFFGGMLFMFAGIAFLLTFWFAIAGDADFARGITVLM